MSNWIVTLYRGQRDKSLYPEVEATRIVPDQVDRYPSYTMVYGPGEVVRETVVMTDCTRREAINGASSMAEHRFGETRNIR